MNISRYTRTRNLCHELQLCLFFYFSCLGRSAVGVPDTPPTGPGGGRKLGVLSGRVRAGASLVSGKLREPPGSPGSDGPGRGPVRTRVVFSDRGYPGRLCKLGCQVRARGTPTVSCPRPLLPEHRVCSFCDWTGAASPAGWAGRAGRSERPFVVRCALVAEPRGGHRPRPANGASRGSGQRGQVTSPQYTAHECLLGWNLVCLSVQHHSSGAAARGGGAGLRVGGARGHRADGRVESR